MIPEALGGGRGPEGGMSVRVLLAGESWSVEQLNVMGFDRTAACRYHEAARPLLEAFKSRGFTVEYYPNHLAQLHFPDTLEALQGYDAIVLSDIGSNTLLLHPETQSECVRRPNRLALIREYVRRGGGLLMCGGYMSFSGFDGRARYAMTPIADVLPVEMLNYDDRMECPEGVTPVIIDGEHEILRGVDSAWPHLLGYNLLRAKSTSSLLATVGPDHPLLVAGSFGAGRSIAFASDCVPHWGTPEFVGWHSYGALFSNMITWLAGMRRVPPREAVSTLH
jgi:uncharacterized membrane protein